MGIEGDRMVMGKIDMGKSEGDVVVKMRYESESDGGCVARNASWDGQVRRVKERRGAAQQKADARRLRSSVQCRGGSGKGKSGKHWSPHRPPHNVLSRQCSAGNC